VSNPNPDNPRQPDDRTAQPESYDLAPEYSAPPAPQYPPPPASGYPPPAYQPGYPQPASEQPAYQPGYPQQPGQPQYPPAGYPQPGFTPGGQPYPAGGIPPKKKHTGLVIGLIVVGVVLLGCCGVGAVFGAPILHEYPAKVTAPDNLAGLAKQQNAQVDQLGDQLGQELKKTAKVDEAVAGLYAAQGDPNRLVLVVGASGFLLTPDKEIDNAFAGMSGSGLPVSSVSGYESGTLGGTVKCGSGTVSGLNLSVCAWGDHGSIGMGIFYGRAVTESAEMFLKIREGMVDRG
jgi:hypothetical protein